MEHKAPHASPSFLCSQVPPISSGEGDCERIFSKTGLIYCPRGKILLPSNCKMMLVTNGALRAFNFLLDGDVELNLPYFIAQERDIVNAVINDESDDELHL